MIRLLILIKRLLRWFGRRDREPNLFRPAGEESGSQFLVWMEDGEGQRYPTGLLANGFFYYGTRAQIEESKRQAKEAGYAWWQNHIPLEFCVERITGPKEAMQEFYKRYGDVLYMGNLIFLDRKTHDKVILIRPVMTVVGACVESNGMVVGENIKGLYQDAEETYGPQTSQTPQGQPTG